MKFFKSNQTPAEKELDPSGGMNVLALAALCGACLLGALVVAPQLGDGLDRAIATVAPQYAVDHTTTAGIEPKENTTDSKPKVIQYFESYSVLNKDPRKPCIVKIDGVRGPEC